MYRTTEVPRHDAPKPAQTSVRRRKKRAAGGIAAGLACAMAVALAPQSAEATLGLADCSEWAVFGGLWLDHDRHVDGTLILEEETSPGVWTLVESIPSDLGFIPAYLEFYIGGPFSAPLSAGRYRVRVEGVVYFNATEALTAAQKMSWPVADTWTYNYQEATPFTCGAGAPVITSTPILTATVSEGWSYQVTISDAPGDTHTYAAEPFPMGSPGGAVLGQNGLITWTPASWQVGPRIFGLSVTDQTGLNDIQIFLVDVRPHTNPPPVITPIGPQVVYVGDALRIQVDATDDYVGPLTYDLSTKPDGMTITSTGAISWLPDGDQVGTSTVVVTVTDYYDATSTEQFTVEVRPALGPNTPPTLSPIADIQVDQGSLLSVTATATDPDPNEQLTFSLSIAPPGVTIDSASGAIQWTPGQADVGSHPFEVSVTDRAGASVSTTFTVLVVEVNDPPFFTNAPPPSPIAVGVTFVFQLTASDPDPADAVTFVKLAGPAALTVSAAGLITWPTTGADLGTQNVQVAVRDTGGLEAVETYALTVNSTQIPPSLGTGLLENAAEDQAYQAQLTATDPDIGEVLQFSLSGAPAGMSVDGQTGTVTWRPTQAQVGLHSVTAIVTDSAGLTDQRLTVITVAEVNDAPEITSTPPTAATQGSEYRYTVSASDPDPGDTLTFELGGAPGGATLDPASGLLTWTPGPDQTGPQTLSVRVRDAAGATDAQSVAVTVANVNDPPVFAGPPTDTEAVEGEPYTYQLSAEDPDGDTLTFSRSSGPSGLTVSADGVVAWTPGFDAAGGTHAVDVEVSDGNLQASLSFTLTVLDVNRAPTFGAVADQTVAEDQTLSLTLPVSEPDGEAMTFVVEEGPVLAVWNPTTRTYQSSPAVTVDAAGVLTYLASGRHVGTQTLRVRAEDPSGASDRVAFAVTVTPINDPPVFQTTPPTSALVNQVYSYAARATDEDSSGLAYRLVSGPASMTVDPVAGLVSWVPRAADLGSQDIVLEVSDTVATARQEFTVTVTDPGPSCAVDPTAAGCQALAWSYALARDGTPIGGAFVDQVGPTLAMRSSDLDSGRVGLGGGEGAYSWVLSASQYVSVSARATLARGDAQWIAFPRMAPLTDLGGPIPADAPVTFEDPDQRVDLILAAQGLGAPRQLAAAILDGQSLPGWLPEGWSLVRGVYFTSDTVLSPAATARMYLPAPLPSGTSSLVLAHWDETLLEWRMVASVPTAGVTTSVDVSLTQGMGGYALVLPDVSPAAPPTPTLNALLAPVAGSGSAELGQLEGRVEPAQQVASLDARDVTGRGLVARTHTAPLSSGAVVPAVLEESFRFSDGRSTLVPDAGLSVAFYQYPPNPEQVPATGMHSTYAAFEILPRQLYPVETLDLARQTVELRRTSEAAQVAVDNQGGAVADGAVSVSVPTGALSEVTLVELETLAAERFQSDGEPAVSAFRLAWTGGDALAALEASFGGTFEPGRCHVLARQLVDAAEGGWTPVERFTVSATGQLESAEATAAERLEGIRTGGTYAVFAGAQLCPDVVAGEVRDTLAAPVAGARVDVLDTRWATRTPLSGAYRLLQAPGASTDLHAQTPAGLEGRASTPNAGPQTGLQITVANPVFEVVQVEPAPSPTVSISPLSRFRVQFGQALSAEAQASSTGLTLRQGTTVLASTVQVASGGYALELTPNAPLPMGVTLTLEVEASLTSAQASTLQGTRSFGFLTHAPVLRSVGEPQLISYAPGQAVTPCHGFDTSNPPPGFDPGWEAYPVPGFDASNPRHTCVVGTTGVAEPASSVILVNEETGNTSTTLAAVNGSFRGVLEADERDLLSANLRNLNGTTLTLELEQQRFDDGSVALYRAGGTIPSAELSPVGTGPLELVIEPGALTQRAKFRFVGKTLASYETENGALVAPQTGEPVMVAEIDYEGPELRQPLDIRIPIDAAQFPGNIPEAERGFLLVEAVTVPVEGTEVRTYNVLDDMKYENGVLQTNSPPFLGPSLAASASFARTAWTVLTARFPQTYSGHVAYCPDEDPRCASNPSAVLSDLLRETATPPRPARETPRLLPNAIVSAAPPGPPGSGAPAIQPGALVSMSNARGKFALVVPSGYALYSRHPDFPGAAPKARALGVASAAGGSGVANIFYGSAEYDAAQARPTVSASTFPLYPGLLSPSNTDLLQAPDAERARLALRAWSTRPGTAAGITFQVAVEGVTPSDPNNPLVVGDVRMVLEPEAPDAPPSPDIKEAAYLVGALRPGTVRLKVTASLAGLSTEHFVNLDFGQTPPPPPATTPNPGTDRTGPMVVRPMATSLTGAHLALPSRAAPVVLQFNEAIDNASLSRSLSVEPAGPFSFHLSRDGRELQIYLSPEAEQTQVEIELKSTATDLYQNALDQDPITAGPQPYTLTVDVPAEVRGQAIADLGAARVRASAFHGRYMFVVDQTTNAVIAYDQGADPLNPTRIGEISFASLGRPMDVLVIPRYSYVTSQTDCTAPLETLSGLPYEQQAGPILGPPLSPCLGTERTLLVVIGGSPGTFVESLGAARRGGYVRVYDLGPSAPSTGGAAVPLTFPPRLVAGTRLGTSAQSIPFRMDWAPPYLTYLEVSDNTNSVHALNLQAFLLGSSLTTEQAYGLPSNEGTGTANPLVDNLVGVPGFDQNGDGDYADQGELVPLPARSAAFGQPLGVFGKAMEIFGRADAQRFYEVTFQPEDLFVGAAFFGQTGEPFYETLGAENRVQGVQYPDARLALPAGITHFDAIASFRDVRLPVRSTTGELVDPFGGTLQQMDLVAVSARRDDGYSRIYLVNVTDIRQPRLLEPVTGIVVPGSNDAMAIDTIEFIDLEDEHLVLEGRNGVVTLALDRLTMGASTDPTRRHPSVASVAPGQGARQFGQGQGSDFGLGLSHLDRAVAFTGPQLSVVHFPEADAVVTPETLTQKPLQEMRATLDEAVTVDAMALARFDAERSGAPEGSELVGDSPAVEKHYHALIRAPGAIGPTLQLQVDTLDVAGTPVRATAARTAPARAGSTTTRDALKLGDGMAPAVTARRLSSDPVSDLYNVYLSEPLVVVGERLTEANLTTLREAKVHAFHSGYGLRVSLDTANTGALLEAFKNEVTARTLSLDYGSHVDVATFPMWVAPGPNPEAPVGAMPVGGSYGMVSSSNGELTMGQSFFDLPSGRIPLAFSWTYRSQIQHHGALGPGITHDYAQRLVEAQPGTLDGGYGLIVRDTEAATRRVREGDVVLHTGTGEVQVFRYEGEDLSAPALSVISADPLVQALDWDTEGAAFYLPEPGVFDVLVKFEDGRWGRLTPDGMQYWYYADGRLDRIQSHLDDPAQNQLHRQVLRYEGPQLRRVSDQTYSAERFLDFGYVSTGAPRPVQGLSGALANAETQLDAAYTADGYTPRSVGQLAKVVDFVGRSYQFGYDAKGRLDEIRGIDISKGAGFKGRPKTSLSWDDTHAAIDGYIPPGSSGPLLSIPEFDDEGRARQVTSLEGTATLTFSHGNRAEWAQQSKTDVALAFSVPATAPGAETYTFDNYGAPASVSQSTSAGLATTTYTHTFGRLRGKVTRPEGNARDQSYANAATALRSRGNVINTAMEPGARGGGRLTSASPTFDGKYNLPTGNHTDYNGVTRTYTPGAVGTCPDCAIGAIAYGNAGTGTAETMTYDVKGELTTSSGVTGLSFGRTLNDLGIPEGRANGAVSTTLSYQGSEALGIEAALGWTVDTQTPGRPRVSTVYDEMGRVLSQTVGLRTETTVYDQDGYPESVTRTVSDGTQQEETFTYGPDGFLESRTLSDVETGESPMPGDQTWIYTRGPRGSVAKEEGPDRVVTYDLDAVGQATKITTPEVTIDQTFDLNGNRRTRKVGTETTTYVYDGHDRLVSTELPGNRVYETKYASGTLGFSGGFEVRRGNETLLSGTQSAHDALGRPERMSQGGGSKSDAWTMSHGTATARASSVTGSGIDRSSTYDASGRQTGMSLPNVGYAEATPAAQYDGFALMSVDRTERGRSRGSSFTRDDNQDVTAVLDTYQSLVTAYDRRADGRVERVERPDGVVTTTPHDTLGRSLGRVSDSGVENAVRYDAEGREVVHGTPLGARRGFRYKPGSQQVEFVDYSDGSSAELSYTAEGRVDVVTLPGGITLDHDYQDGQLRQRALRGGAREETETYSFDALGRPTTRSSSLGELTMLYEGAYVDKVEGRIVVDTAPPSAFPYSIDVDEVAEGVTQVEYPDGTVMVCELDGQASGETVKRCTVGGAEILAVSRYATVSQPAALTLGAGALYRSDTYDERTRLTERTYGWDAALAPETVAFKHAYNYTGGDREVWREITRRSTRQGAAEETHDFARYDADGRLRWTERGATATTAASGNLVVFPSFSSAPLSGTLPPTATASAADDVVGNRNFLQGTYGRTYSFTGDRLTSVATRGTGPAMAPDTAFDRFARTQTQDRDSLGNIQTLPHPSGTLTLTYDGFSRLIGIAQATAQGTIQYTYRYRVDGLLQEKKKVCGAVPNCVSAHELYLYDHRGYLLEIRDVELGNAVVAQYYYAAFDAEVPVAMKLDGQMYYPAVDRQGSVMRLVDSAGNVVEEVSYDAFGQPTVTAPSMSVSQSQSHVQNRLLFQSHLWDADVGLYFMRARVFDPYLGHFLQRDPAGYVDSVNLYAGFAWDPVNNRDPSGEFVCGGWCLVGAGVTAVVSLFATEGVANAPDEDDVTLAAPGPVEVVGKTAVVAAAAPAGVVTAEALFGTSVGVGGTMAAGASAGGIASPALLAVEDFARDDVNAGFTDYIEASGNGIIAGGFLGLGFGVAGQSLRVIRGVPPRMRTVTSWAEEGIAPDLNAGRWVQLGGPTRLNFLKTGLPGPKLVDGQLVGPRVPFRNHITGRVPEDRLRPAGGLKAALGQRRIIKRSSKQ